MGRLVRPAAAWGAAVALIVLSVWWGVRLQREHPEIFLGAAPLVGRDPADGWDWRFGWGLAGAALVGSVVTVGVWRGWCWRLRLRTLVFATGAAAACFSVLLALTDGRDGILYGATHDTEYLANLDIAPPAAEFVRDFLSDIDHYSVHVRGHPPGFVLVLKMLDAVGLEGGWPAAMLSVLACMVTPVAVLIAVWAVAGPEWVRRSAPFLVVAPYALWMVTSADAVFTAVGALGVAACALGLRSTGWRSAWLGATGGLLLGALLFLTYAAATFALVPAVIALALRRARGALPTVTAAVCSAVVVVALFAASGFWWFSGATETRRQYWAGTAQFRPLAYFAVANLAAALIAVGPATYGGLLRLWRTRRAEGPILVLVVAGALALLVTHASQFTRGEVERIWLLFFPWLVIAGGAVMRRSEPRLGATAVGVQVVTAVLLQAALVSKW